MFRRGTRSQSRRQVPLKAAGAGIPRAVGGTGAGTGPNHEGGLWGRRIGSIYSSREFRTCRRICRMGPSIQSSNASKAPTRPANNRSDCCGCLTVSRGTRMSCQRPYGRMSDVPRSPGLICVAELCLICSKNVISLWIWPPRPKCSWRLCFAGCFPVFGRFYRIGLGSTSWRVRNCPCGKPRLFERAIEVQ